MTTHIIVGLVGNAGLGAYAGLRASFAGALLCAGVALLVAAAFQMAKAPLPVRDQDAYLRR